MMHASSFCNGEPGTLWPQDHYNSKPAGLLNGASKPADLGYSSCHNMEMLYLANRGDLDT